MPKRVFGLVLTVLLAASSVTLMAFAHQLQRTQEVPVANGGRQIVRTYYANVNTFLQGGDIDPLISLFNDQAFGSESATNQRCDKFRLESGWRALRATYPDLVVDVESEESVGEYSLVEVSFQTDRTSRPLWIPFDEVEIPSGAIELFRTDGQHLIDYRTTLWPTLALELTSLNKTFLTHTGQLTISALAFTSRSSSFFSIPGPAVLIITAGRLEVSNDPALVWNQVRNNETNLGSSTQPMTPGDSLLAPARDLVVRNVGDLPATAIVITVERLSMPALSLGSGQRTAIPTSITSQVENALRAEIGTSTLLSDLNITPLVRSTEILSAGVGSFHVALTLGNGVASTSGEIGQSIVSLSLNDDTLEADPKTPDENRSDVPFGCLGFGDLQLLAHYEIES